MIKRVLSLVLLVSLLISMMFPVQAAATNNTVTNIDALKIVLDSTGISPKKIDKAKDWKEGYLQAAEEQKIIDKSSFSKKLTTKITKVGAAELFAKALKVKNVKTIYFADSINVYVNTLYNLKIVTGTKGKDGKLYFKPTALITKTELTAIASKAKTYYISNQKQTSVKPTEPTIPVDNTPAPEQKTDEHKAPDYTEEKEVGSTLGDLISSDTSGVMKSPVRDEEMKNIAQPKTIDDFKKVIMYMVYNNMASHTLNYNVSYSDFFDNNYGWNFQDATRSLLDECPEYFSLFSMTAYSVKGTDKGVTVKIWFKNIDYETEGLMDKYNTMITKAKGVVEGLIKDGKLTATMTEKEKALVLYEWICLNCDYDGDVINIDTGNIVHYDSFNAYGALVNKTAVCQGYTALYNLLCRYVGITVMAIPGEANSQLHTRTAQILDGKRVWTDITFGDQGGKYWTSAWFAQPVSEFKADHKWDTEKYAVWGN